MEDCKCGRIPPCYSGRVFNIYEETKKVQEEWGETQERFGAAIDKLRAKLMEGGFADETRDKVYGLNKQMCDIDKHLSEAGYFRKICEGQIEARKKLIVMEEKKTKKMTKADAFEYLKSAKIYVDSQIVAVLEKLFKIGFTWRDGGQEVDFGWSNDDEAYSLIIGDGKLSWVDKPYCGSWFDNLTMPRELRADDILSIEIVEDTKPDCERNEHVKALQELIAKSGYIDCIIISKNDFGILKK